MSWKTEEYKSSEDLRREIADLKIQLAFQEQFEKEVEHILMECENTDAETVKFIREEEQGWLKEISGQIKKRSFSAERFLKSAAGKLVAMVVVLMLVSVSSAMAAIQMVRAGVFALDIVGDNRRMSVRMVKSNNVEVPTEWIGDYYPTFIPEGFELVHIDNIGVWYIDQKGNWMTFDESRYGIRKSIDTENAKVSNIQINGMEATIIEKDEVSSIIWATDERYFAVGIVGEKEVAIHVAASVMMCK